MQEPEVQFALAIESPEHPAAELATSIEELIVTGVPEAVVRSPARVQLTIMGRFSCSPTKPPFLRVDPWDFEPPTYAVQRR